MPNKFRGDGHTIRCNRPTLAAVPFAAGLARFGEVARGLRARLVLALTLSQACWWTTVLIGLFNSALRRWSGS